MKTINELKKLLLEELKEYVFDADIKEDSIYYNEQCGMISSILSSILDKELRNINDWDSNLNWIDDCLLTKIQVQYSKCKIWGIMIWGKRNTTEQWTDPYYFELNRDLIHKDKDNIVMLFGDQNYNSIVYSEFNDERGIWDHNFYSDNRWDINERNWNFIISSNLN